MIISYSLFLIPGVEIAETNLATESGMMLCLVENDGTVLDARLELSGMATDTSANITGTGLWQVSLFLSSDGTSVDNILPAPALATTQVSCQKGTLYKINYTKLKMKWALFH